MENQIESHMRLCTVVTNGFELLLTTVGSEPLLAEAAAQAMVASKMSPVKLLSTYMDTNCVSVGERGELVAALLVMRARDELAASTSERWVRVIDFMQKLVACPELRTGLPRYAQEGKAQLQFQEAFKESRIWMNHVLKVRHKDLMNVKYLWRFVSRGAMVLCANGQQAVDIVIPVVHSGSLLSRDKMTAILIQVKNDKNIVNLRGHLFDDMNRFVTNFFRSTVRQTVREPPPPIIRMVFSLASVKGGTEYRKPPTRVSPRKGPDKFTEYDIWCSGLDTDTFPLIRDDDRHPYKDLLARTRDGGQLYDMKSQRVKYPTGVMEDKCTLLRQFNPLLETGLNHQSHLESDTEESKSDEESEPDE